jgi:hypothetical protein
LQHSVLQGGLADLGGKVLRDHFDRRDHRQIGDITRTDIVRLLDRIADKSGAPMADHVLAHLRRVYASRSDDFRSPIVRGMARPRPSQRRRQRVLSDDELRAVWRAAEASQSAFGCVPIGDGDMTHGSGWHAA